MAPHFIRDAIAYGIGVFELGSALVEGESV